MKPYIFDEQEYEDLNSLGLAFVNRFDLALQAIKEKAFVKFFKRFKTYKKSIQSLLYQSRFLQNALSMIIYLVTEEHILYVGHRRYRTIQEILKDIKSNKTFVYFAQDHGFSNTILPTIEDEKLKADLLAFEENHDDDFALDYLAGYMQKDSIESIGGCIQAISNAKDPFKEALCIFKSRQIQLSLAYRYSLSFVLELRKKHCPVFSGFSIVRGDIELPLSILEEAFYQSILINYKKYKYKGLEGKNFRRKIKDAKKASKKYNKMSDIKKIEHHEKIHTLYLEWVDLYKIEKIKIKDSNLEPTIPYCDTYASSSLLEEKMLLADTMESPYTSVVSCEYNLRKLEKSLKNHGYFSFWSIFLTVLITIGYVFLGLIPSLRNMIISFISQILDKKVEELQEIPMLIHILCFVGAGLAILVAIVIAVLRSIAKKKYNRLCRLAYYRKNSSILLEKEQTEYEKLKISEERYAKKIDRFYRFYGGVGMAGLSLAATLATLAMIYACGFVINESIKESVFVLLTDKVFYIFIGPVICLLLCFARHKKTAWSVIFTYILSVGIAVGLLFLVKLL
ncbi:MAG: hypothetical protein NC310_03800 [Roseburia sp.]|nr:hypothetical protein [Anaeroplasma bactoclasticum]MCM1196183.1 hypothetical protein [Roseburia sp.]MCM1556271.1 hypothetical protein [Anaeroplasma bactoclasticum]